jgi:hypothetical protein
MQGGCRLDAGFHFHSAMQSIIQEAQKKMESAQEQQAKYANQKRRELTFQVGDKVLLSTQNLAVDSRNSRKLTPKWTRPFTIVKKHSDVAYQLDLPSDWRIHNVFHVNLLKPCPVDATFDDDQEYFRPGPIPSTKNKYIVQRLLDRRTVGTGRNRKQEYLVHWKGYPAYESTWEPESNLTGSEVQKWKTLLDQQR